MAEKYILQICHGYDGPFLDCARQYESLFENSSYKVITLFLTGAPSDKARNYLHSAEILFYDYSSSALKGLKREIIGRVKQLDTKYQFSACIAHRTKPTYVALMSTKIPVFSVHHAFGDFDRLGRRLFVNLFKKRLTLLAVSNAVRDEIQLKLPHWDKDRIQTLYNRINIKEVRPNILPKLQAKEALNLPKDAWIAGNVGRLHPDKDQATLIQGFHQALDQLPDDAALIIIGQGKQETKLKELAVSLDITEKVIFLGAVENAKNYFKAFDVFVLSSDHEPFGMVLLEAMAAEIPIISSDCGGAAEIVNGHGILFELMNTNALARALTQVHMEPNTNNVNDYDNILIDKFSDQSARKQFWQIPSVIDGLG